MYGGSCSFYNAGDLGIGRLFFMKKKQLIQAQVAVQLLYEKISSQLGISMEEAKKLTIKIINGEITVER